MADHEETPSGEKLEKNSQEETNSSIEEQQEQVELLDTEALLSRRKNYEIGEVPQPFLFDPEGSLPLNAERLGAKETLHRSIEELEQITRDEIASIHKFQRLIDDWETTIEKNKELIESNKAAIRQNNTDMLYDEKNRDYWWRRAEGVVSDFGVASASDHRDTWAWFIKKHGLKGPDGSSIDDTSSCVEELCNGSSSNLASKYKVAGGKYDMSKNHREKENFRMIAENSHYKKSLETLQHYVQSTYQNKVEPLQDGVLLLKELTAKLRGFLSQPDANYGDLRSWAESFLNDYIIENPLTPQHAITDFRKWASIPLPSENH